jgi:hypothetical protein
VWVPVGACVIACVRLFLWVCASVGVCERVSVCTCVWGCGYLCVGV